MTTKEKIQLLQNLSIGSQPKAMIVLLLLGYRSGVELDLFSYNDPALHVLRTLRTIGLHCDCLKKEKNVSDAYRATVCISDTYENMVNFYKLVEEGSKVTSVKSHYHRLYGAFMGYPQTAIEAFATQKMFSRTMLSLRNYPEDMKYNFFRVFNFSKQHYAAETEVVKAWEAAVQEVAPDIYDELRHIAA